jgi:hypothetical protein
MLGLYLLQGKGLGPVYRSIELVEILSRVQKLYKTGYVTRSQRVQYSCALDPSHSPITKLDLF